MGMKVTMVKLLDFKYCTIVLYNQLSFLQYLSIVWKIALFVGGGKRHKK